MQNDHYDYGEFSVFRFEQFQIECLNSHAKEYNIMCWITVIPGLVLEDKCDMIIESPRVLEDTSDLLF